MYFLRRQRDIFLLDPLNYRIIQLKRRRYKDPSCLIVRTRRVRSICILTFLLFGGQLLYFTESYTFDSRLNFDEVPPGKNCRPFFGIFGFEFQPSFATFSRSTRHELLLALKRVDARYLVPSSKKNDVPARRLNFRPGHATFSCSSTYSKTRNYVLEKVLAVSMSLSHRLFLQRLSCTLRNLLFDTLQIASFHTNSDFPECT